MSGKAVRGEIAVKHKDGHEFPSSFSAVPIEKGGKVVGLSGVVRDISEQEKATQVLRQMALFAELNPGPVLRFDHNGVILSSNPAALTVLGEKAKEGSQLASVTPAMADIDLERCIREGLVLVHEELVGQKHFQLVIRGVPELGIGHVYGSDISERKRAEKKLQSVNEQMKSDLETAAKMQLSLLPRARPDVPGVRLAWAFKPCEELAGDIFNVFLLDKKHLACISHHCSSRSGGRAGLTRRTTGTDAGVLVQYVEEVEGAQRRQDGWFRRCSRVVMRNAG